MNEKVTSLGPDREMHSKERNHKGIRRVINLLEAAIRLIRADAFLLVLVDGGERKTEMQVSGIRPKGAILILSEALEGLMLSVKNDEKKKPELPGELTDQGAEEFLKRMRERLN